MKSSAYLRISLSLFLMLSMLAPGAVVAQKGDAKKQFNIGMKHEAAGEWDLAAEAFALAVAGSPKNPEYLLHMRRSIFNASQMFMRRGRILADEGDFQGAYIAFRRAYAFDPVNELARSEMARMVRLQEDLKKGEAGDTPSDVRLVQTGLNNQPDPTGFRMPQKLEVLRNVPFPSGIPLQQLVKDLAKSLDLNVLFDVESRLEGRIVRIELQNVTAAKALDYVFLQENLFFQRVGPRTILVASGNRRANFQQLVLRTFYLANANPKDVKTVVQTAIPAQPGRSQTIVLEDAATNSITIRDTEENIRLIGRLISSLDKDRAEVVMDVAIYEVNKTDLMQFGNQIGTAGANGTLLNLGGVGFPYARAGSTGPITSNLPFPGLDLASIAIGLPISTIQALQTKSNTKLLASTQIHAFNNEDSSARIGQRVPVRTASFAPVGGTTPGQGNNFIGDVINYEQVGLTLKFKPIVFPNQDVQVAMDIESKDVSGAQTLTPVFTERKITGTARIQNNKTLLLASVAQDVESRGRTGLPLLGLIPILGRLFTAPTRDNRQVDIVIAITPRVIRAPAILPEDEIERPTGSIAVPTSGSLEAMVIQEEREEYLASVRRLPTAASVQLPDRAVEAPAYVRSTEQQQGAVVNPPADSDAAARPTNPNAGLNLRPIDSSARDINLTKTSELLVPLPPSPLNTLAAPAESNGAGESAERAKAPTAQVALPGQLPELKAGQRLKIPVRIEASAAFRSAVLGIKFDPRRVAVRDVTYGDVFGSRSAGNIVLPFLNQNGKMFVSLSPEGAGLFGTSGVLAYIEIEALSIGTPEITLEREVLNFLGADGRNFSLNF
ncbi:MAG: hypothetical protein H0V76_10850 [Blastocatellia bacterium]|nr:hypothetical protein [Blastocatellia bacterium]